MLTAQKLSTSGAPAPGIEPMKPGHFASLPGYERLALILGPVLILVTVWMDLFVPAESDKAWLLHVARMWLEGRKLYVDVVEANPPLIIWFYALPVWISMHVSWIADYEALGFIGVIGCALSVMVGTQLIKWHPAFADNTLKQAEFAVLQGLVLLFYTTQLYFFDRDHIFYVMAFPYMVRFMPSLAEVKFPLRLRMTVGVMAAVGFCMKPHTVIVFSALQLFTIVRARSFAALLSLENFIVAGAFLLYLLLVMHFTPDFISIIIPLELATYSEFANQGESYAYMPPIFMSLGLIFADYRPRLATPYRRDVLYFLGLCFAFIAYAQAQNGWGYTYHPMYMITIFTTGWMLWEYTWLRQEHKARRVLAPRAYFGLRGCLIVFVMHAAFMFAYLLIMSTHKPAPDSECTQGPYCWRNSPFTRYIEEHNVHSFGTLSLDFGKWVMLVRMPGVEWDTRFNHLWMLPRLEHSGEAYMLAHYRWVLEYMGKSLADDLNHRKPEIMLVDTSPGFMGMVRRFDYPVYLSRVPEFKEAWTHYRYDQTISTCKEAVFNIPTECRYDVYKRVP